MEKQIKSSGLKYLMIALLMLLLCGLSIKLYIDLSKIPMIKSVNNNGKIKSSNFNNLDSCIFQLYNAENSFRMYVVSGNHQYYQDFSDQIKNVSRIIDSLEHNSLVEEPFSDDYFSYLIAQKHVRTTQFIQLKKLSDSLINYSINAKSKIDRLRPIGKIFSARQFKSIIRTDTLKDGVAAQPKKKFFGRILAAINDKGVAGVDSSRTTVVKTTIDVDTSTLSVAYNNLQLKKINNFYTKLYNTNKAIKQKELDILEVNHQIIAAVLSNLKAYKVKELDYYNTVHDIVSLSTYDVIKKLDKLTLFLGLLVLALTAFILFAIYKLYQKERSLVDHSNKASLYAVSKSRFLANMSHEIRTPLNSIIGFSEQLTQVDLAKVQKEQILAIKNSSTMLLDVVNDILDFSKYETGKVAFEEVSFSPSVNLADLFYSMKILADKKKIAYVFNNEVDDSVYVLGDPLRLKQVVMNLLSNAIKFTKSGQVTLNLKLENNNTSKVNLKVSVSDTGSGINVIDQKIIFDEFAQVYYASTKEKQQGTGLGLAICKKIVELQGGTITVSSEEGKGSVFSFELPFQISKKPDVGNGEVFKTGIAYKLVGKKILLADDNALNILLASTILKKFKIEFDAVYDGKEAFEAFMSKQYDLVLTDIQMPEMGGIELTKKIRALEGSVKANIPILGVTANVLQEDREKYIQSGMNELVLKPFLEKELIDKILKFI